MGREGEPATATVHRSFVTLTVLWAERKPAWILLDCLVVDGPEAEQQRLLPAPLTEMGS